jgi:acetyltransferase-like isoleucine patch superfamily enzyme
VKFKLVLAALLQPLATVFSGAGRNWRRLWAFSSLRNSLPGQVDPSVVVEGPVELHGTRQIRLGRDLYLYRDLYWETREQGAITIGDGVVMSRGVHVVAYASVRIGDGTMVGEYASIRDANHKRSSDGPRDSGHVGRAISIGRRVWIGRGATILPGVNIGDDAIVGANAVVTRDVAAGSVVAGVPARVVVTRKTS